VSRDDETDALICVALRSFDSLRSLRTGSAQGDTRNVTNLAGKLFALDPSVTPEQVRELIVNGASPIVGNNLKLIDPKHSVALLRSNAFGSR
jgi:hypothetical protein